MAAAAVNRYNWLSDKKIEDDVLAFIIEGKIIKIEMGRKSR